MNHCSFRHSSRKRPLNDSMYAFCVGLPGSISRSVTPQDAKRLQIRVVSISSLIPWAARSKARTSSVCFSWGRGMPDCDDRERHRLLGAPVMLTGLEGEQRARMKRDDCEAEESCDGTLTAVSHGNPANQ